MAVVSITSRYKKHDCRKNVAKLKEECTCEMQKPIVSYGKTDWNFVSRGNPCT